VDTEAIRPLEGSNPMRKKLDIDSDTIVALYSGSMGQKQGINTILGVAQKLKSNAKIKFVLCGDGSACSRIQSRASGLTNVIYLPLQPVERLNYLLNLADIHLLPQRANVAELVMPSKLTGILASGRPVVTSANPDTQIAQVVDGCGIAVNPEDADAFAESLLWLAEQPKERQRLGKAGRIFAIKKLSKDKILSGFENVLQKLVNK
jgi:colanic acid biosynthesis glycosyl transferase WcaI